MINQILRPKILNRKRINKILAQVFDVPIFFISASMGYGKTIAVKNFLDKNNEGQVIWFNSATEDNDDIWMWQKFCNSIKNINFNLGESLDTYGFPKNNMEAYKVIDIIRDEIKQKTVLVIDECDDIKASYINYLIKAISLDGVPNLHIVIISRNRPPDEYVELELKRKCIIMWQDDMAFTFNETVAFFESNGLTLTEKEKNDVYNYTGGWTSATYLALLQYYNKNTFDNIPKATGLIKTAVYDKFDETTKEILLKLSVVENFTLEQAIYITEDKKCNFVIRNLISNNCFIKYDRKTKIYTLHSILKSALDEEIIYSNVDIDKINNISGDWYSKNDDDIHAIEYYYRAKNFPRILDLLERNNIEIFTCLDSVIIKSVFNELSINEKLRRPLVYLTYIFFVILFENHIIGKKLLYEIKDVYESREEMKDKNEVFGEVAFLESLLMFEDVKKMTDYHKKAYKLFQEGTSKIVSEKLPVTFGAPKFIYLYHNKIGELKDTVKLFQQEIFYFIHISNGRCAGVNYLLMAEYFFETGDMDKGELFAYKSLHKANAKKQTNIIISSLFLLGRIYVIKNNKTEARNILNRLINVYEGLSFLMLSSGLEIAVAYINGITGNLLDMNRWIKESEKSRLKEDLSCATLNDIVLGISIILEGNYIKLEIHVETMLEVHGGKNNIFGNIYAYIFESISKLKLYSMSQAKKSLLKAVNLAKDDNITTCFVELAPHILLILKELEKENEYVKSIMSKCERFNEIYINKYDNNSPIVELTPRELEIMKLVDEGYKQSEISKELNIALVTVKKHIASVYFKLNVKSKTIAINLLKQKGII